MFIGSSPGRWSDLARSRNSVCMESIQSQPKYTYIKGKVIEISNNVSGPLTKSSTLAILARESL